MKRALPISTFLLMAGLLAGQALPPNVQPLTTAPESEHSPTLSADGRHLVFVGEQRGRTDLYALDLRARSTSAPRPLHASPARDEQPALSPDGRWLAWVSTREDAFGDVYVARFPSGTPVRIGTRGIREDAPHWTRRGRTLVLRYRIEQEDATARWMELDAGAWTREPRVAGVGDDYAPPRRLVAVALDDTNGDGIVDGERGDLRSVCEVDADGRFLRQLTPPIRGLADPIDAGDQLIFSAAWRPGRDLFRTTDPFEVATLRDSSTALDAARRAWAEQPGRPFEVIALARQGIWLDTPGQRAAALECLVLALDVLRSHDRPEQALGMLRETRERLGEIPPAMDSRIAGREALLRLEAATRAGAGESAVAAMRARAEELLGRLVDDATLPASERAWAAVERARQLHALGRSDAALATVRDAQELSGMSADDRARLALERARLLAPVLEGEARAALVELMRRNDVSMDVREETGREFAQLAQRGHGSVDARVLALRQAASAVPDLALAAIATRLAEGRVFAHAGRWDEARAAFEVGREGYTDAPRLAAECAFALAEIHAREGQFVRAIETYESVGEEMRTRVFPEAPAFYEQAREGLIRESLEKGAIELRLGDPWLALTTYRALLDREPRLVEGWRGRIECEARTGLLAGGRLQVYREQARRQREEALAQYLYGLALTYEPMDARRALDHLKRAVELDNSVPYYHQTLGFLHEHLGRTRDDRGHAAEALESYQRALGLIDPAARPGDYARLLLNAGNAASALGQYARAAEFYARRIDQGVPFDDPRTEFLMRRNHGIALFRSGRPAPAVDAFRLARALVEPLAAAGVFENPGEVRTELMDREALALFDAGRHREAATLFERVAGRQPEFALDRARALRNAGFALLREARGRQGSEQVRVLREAERVLERALGLLESPRLEMPGAGRARRGLLDMELSVSAAGPAGARTELTREDEVYLVRAALARLRAESPEPGVALDALRAQLESQKKLDRAGQPYYRLARTVTLDRMAREYARQGRFAEASAALIEAVELTRFVEKNIEAINAAGLAQTLAHLAEVALASGDANVPDIRALRGMWIAEGVEGTSNIEILEGCLRAALARRDPATDLHLALDPSWRGRLLLASALLAERRAGESTPEAAVHAARAAALADRTIALANDPLAGEEARRFALLAHGLHVRLAAQYEPAETRERLRRRALVFAERMGLPEMAWWLEAQASFVAEASVSRMAARRALERLEESLPGLAGAGTPPLDMLAHCEDLLVAEAVAAGRWDEALALTERWRAARLKLLMDGVVPPERRDDETDVRWRMRALRLRGEYRRAVLALRATPVTGNVAAAQQLVETARAEWAEHLAQGRAALHPSALLLAPGATPVADPAAALDDLLGLPESPVVVLATRHGAAAWADGEVRSLATSSDAADLLARPRPLFVLGDAALPFALPGNAVHILTFETTFQAMQEFRLQSGIPALAWPGDAVTATGAPALPEAGEARAGWRVEPPLVLWGFDPARWTPAGVPVVFGEFLAAVPGADRAEVRIAPEDPSAAAHARRLMMASLLAHSGAASVRLDDEAWVGLLPAPGEAPEVALQELRAAEGLAVGFLRDGTPARALPPIRRVLGLRQALDEPPAAIVEAGLLMAQLHGDVGDFEQATRTMRDVVATLRPMQDKEALARALRLLGSYALSAFRHDEALAAYTEASVLYAGLGQDEDRREMDLRAGIALENAGLYNGALAQFEAVLQEEQAQGNLRAVAEHWRRIGRIYLHRLNDYLFAEDAFEQALEAARAADASDLVIQLTLDIARVDERLGRYEPAIAITMLMEEQAREADVPLLEVDALAIRAFTQWVRADYFEAYRSLRRGMELAERIGAREHLLIGHNTGGLLAWSLNDTDSALGEFGEALALARQLRLPTEESSTLNNRALVYRSLGRHDAALADLEAALAIDRRTGSIWGQAYVLRNIGITWQQMGRAEEAIAPLEQAARLSAQTGDRTNRTKALVALGDAQREAGASGPAQAAYDEALVEARALPLPEVEWRALYGLALLADQLGDAPRRLRLLGEAIEVVERLRARIRVEEFQDGFLLDKQSLYDEMVLALLDRGESAGALEYSERSRARNFIDLLGNSKVQLSAAGDQERLEREARLRGEIEDLERRVGAARSEEEREPLEQRLALARRRYSDFLIELRAFNPQLSAFVEVRTMRTDELQALLEADTALVVYHVLPRELVAWVVRRESVRVVRTPVASEELAARVQAFRRRMQNFDRLDDETAILTRLLWTPVRGLLDGATRVGIAPHRELHLFPFAALRDGTGYAIDRHGLFYTPSASVLAYTIARRGRRGENNRVLAIGNPDLGNEALSLPFAEKEARRIPWSFPDADVVLRGEATESWLAENIHNYGIVHFAAHGEFDPNLPLMSAIQLTADHRNDGRLTAQEIFSLSLRADLVTLSACQTGLGRLSTGDDIVGLNRSFVYAGTRQIVSSLWRVDDVSTAVLMKHFYRSMAETDRAEALRRAQLEVRRRYPHPAHWSGLVLSGDWQ
jgi:CHAT domain-containing protein